MAVALILASIVLAYLMGSIPTSVWIGKLFFGIDIRRLGSGNAGTTNAFRVLGKLPAIIVLIIDVLKGLAAANITYIIVSYSIGSQQFITMQLVLGMAAAIGHIYPVWAQFRGGKGIATLFGMTIAIFPEIALISAGVFVLVLLLTQYVSLSSIVAGLSIPILIILIFQIDINNFLVPILIPILILLTHQKNIKRLLKNDENRIYIFRKKKS
ncbi:MAG: glycerol-3-phosphate 1-O-acyltransferase PlsY [Bacteroidetes bacterium]|nr:glycerol-3-phosphate 1-O-acyltransferase PlsY [Bacteroidota bacterium]